MLSHFAQTIFERTYQNTPNESWEGCADRVARFVCQDDADLVDQIRRLIEARIFMPGGRYLYSSGRQNPQVSNCFLFRCGDSAHAWGELFNRVTVASSKGGGCGVEYSQVRPRGAPIAGYGGLASGPVSVMDMVNEIGRGMRAGAQRRTALWAGLNWQHEDVHEFITAKNWNPLLREMKAKDPDFPAPLDQTNISVGLDDAFFEQIEPGNAVWDLYFEIVSLAIRTGEPGFSINLGDKAGHDLRNPCQPDFATVLTPDGIRTFRDIDVGSIIWTGSRWSRVRRKVGTGVKRVYRYQTTAGAFVGTAEHRILQNGERVQAQLATGIDRVGGPNPNISLNPQDVMDGLVMGDGSVHKDDLVYLIIGKEDQDYFDSEISAYLIKNRSKLSPGAWEVATTITAEELGKTYERAVPDRFYMGNASRVAGFLRGLFSANGSVLGCKNRSSRVRATLHQSSWRLTNQVQEMLSSIGICSYVTTNKSNSIGIYECKQSYTLNITSTHFDLFMEQVGFLQTYKDFGSSRSTRSKTTFDIQSIEDLGDMSVFDIEVEAAEHSYWTGGMLVSNCTEIDSQDNGDVCNLGSVNFARIQNLDQLEEAVWLGTQFLYRGTVLGWLPDHLLQIVRDRNRRIGLGILGLHEWCIQRGLLYGPSPLLADWLSVWAEVSDAAAADAAQSFGLPEPIGRRAVAPTGTIGILAETTTGIEPIPTVAYKRRFHTSDGWKYQYVVDPTAQRALEAGVAPEDIEDAGSLAHDLDRRLAMQAFVQRYTDQAISSTINLPKFGAPGNDDPTKTADVLLKHLPELRGVTMYPDGARSGQPIEAVSLEEATAMSDRVFEASEDQCQNGVCGI